MATEQEPSAALNVSPLGKDQPPAPQDDTESLPGSSAVVVWTDEEQALLDKHVGNLEPKEENLQTLFQVALLFPAKTLQQLVMRIHWLAEKDVCLANPAFRFCRVRADPKEVSWPEFCRRAERKATPLHSPKSDSNHSSPRSSSSRSNRRSVQLSKQRSSEDQKRRKRRSVPNGRWEGAAIFDTPPPGTSPASEPSSEPAFVLRSVDPTALQDAYVPYPAPYAPTVLPGCVPAVPLTTPQFATPQYSLSFVTPGPPPELQQIDALLAENNMIIDYVAQAPPGPLDRSCLGRFSTNIKTLLALTDSLSQAKPLPFLSLYLSMPPETGEQQVVFAQPFV